MSAQSENLDAINRFFLTQVKAETPEAAAIKNAWSPWYESLGFYDKNFNGDVFDEARSRRNAFNLANAKTPHEQELAVRVMTTGMSAEEQMGKPKPPIDPKTGSVGTQIKRDQAAQKAIETKPGSYPTIRQGSTGDAVKKWQGLLGVKVDGNFGPGTKTATMAWQKAHALTADGVVGSKTWASALQAAPAKSEDGGMVAALLAPIASSLTSSIPKPASKPAQVPAAQKAYTAAVAAPKPAAPKGGSAKPPVTTIEKPMVAQAGMLSSIKNLPIWAWIGIGAGGLLLAKAGVIKPATLTKKRR